jgi:hypothetical protein
MRTNSKIIDSSSFLNEEKKEHKESYLGNSFIKDYIHNIGREIDNDNLVKGNNGTMDFELFQKNEKIIPISSIASENFDKNEICYSLAQKEWRGYVENVSEEDGEFTAVLKDKSGKESDIRVDFAIDEVSDGDRDLIVEGALIRWIIGKERKVNGQIKNNDYIIFPRFPVWKKEELNENSFVVKDFNDWLNSE